VRNARLALLALTFSLFSLWSVPAAEASRFGMMRMSDAQEQEFATWVEGLSPYGAPTAYNPVQGSVSVLDHFHYRPDGRDQSPTGTCWIWASTAMMSMYFDTQFDGDPRLDDGLSVQFLASNAFMVGSNLNAGGHLGKTKAFYDLTGYAIPSTNTGAAWDTQFSVGEVRPAAIVSGTPWKATGNTSYPISSINISRVKTWDRDSVDRAQAIRNLKSILDAGHPVALLYFLPTTADWDKFDAFWANKPATSIINMDYAKDHSWDRGGCGHWTVLVGYNDTNPDPAKHYWTILNTHGTADGKRPDVTFRLAMNIDYSAQITGNPDLKGVPYMYFWFIMDTLFAERDSPTPPKGLGVISLALDASRPAAVTSVLINGANFSDVPTMIDSGRLTLNFIEIPLDDTTGFWTDLRSEFRFVSRRGYSPSVVLSVNKSRKQWSASVWGPGLARQINSSEGLVGTFEYKAAATDDAFTLLSQRGAVFDQVKTQSSASVKGP
jgi:hypothetical protein